MSDYSNDGAIPVEDAVVDDPPTVDDVLDEQRRRFPRQYATNTGVNPPGDTDGPDDSGWAEAEG